MASGAATIPQPPSLNNIVPLPRRRNPAPLVFSRPPHLGIRGPLLRDLLSGAAGELSSMSLELADTEAWVFRNVPSALNEIEHCSSSGSNAVDGDKCEMPSSPCTSLSSGSLSSLDCFDEVPQQVAGQEPRQAWMAKTNKQLLRRARLIAGLLRLPMSVLSAYMPVGRQHSLTKPDSAPDMAGALDAIRASLQRAVSKAGACIQDSFPADAPSAEEAGPGQPRPGSGESGLAGRDASYLDALQRRLRTIFWMHRLPVYRMRVQEILQDSKLNLNAISMSQAGRGSSSRMTERSGGKPGRMARLADDVAPVMRVDSARMLPPIAGGLQSEGLKHHAQGGPIRQQQGLLVVLTSIFMLVSRKECIDACYLL